MPLALSTSWNYSNHNNGAQLLNEIKNLGFEDVELNFGLTASIVDEIISIAQRGEIKVLSVHNYCPIPQGLTQQEALPDCYAMSSLSEEERRAAVKFTKETIDTACRLNAKAVVLHCGRVEIPDRTKDLITCYNSGMKNNSSRYNELKEVMVRERAQNIKPYFENTLKSLEELNRYAESKNIYLGVENRYYYCEIPSLEEIGLILDTFKGSRLCYWHDSGHAQLMENLGFTKHKDYLESYGKSLFGIHLHDIIGARDHQAPKKGTLDFRMFTPFITKDTLKVMEVHRQAGAEDLTQGKLYLESLLNGKV